MPATGVAEELGGRDHAVAVCADVGDERSVDEALREACLAYGGVDIVVNNAGLSQSAPADRDDGRDRGTCSIA